MGLICKNTIRKTRKAKKHKKGTSSKPDKPTNIENQKTHMKNKKIKTNNTDNMLVYVTLFVVFFSRLVVITMLDELCPKHRLKQQTGRQLPEQQIKRVYTPVVE